MKTRHVCIVFMVPSIGYDHHEDERGENCTYSSPLQLQCTSGHATSLHLTVGDSFYNGRK